MSNIKTKIDGGVLGEYYEKVINALVNIVDVNQHVDTYIGEKHVWYAEPEFTGKYVDLCVKIHERYGDKKSLEHAKMVVDSIIKNMRPDGYIGNLAKDSEFINFGVWNQAFTVFGMLSYYRVTKDKRVLDACEKCVAFVMDYFLKGSNDILDCINNGTQHPSILFVLSDMYRFTGKEIYMKYIHHILERFRNSDLNFLQFDSIMNLRSKKGIEIFVILLGILKYAELTNDVDAIESVKKYWQEINDTQIRNTGNGTLEEVWCEKANAPAQLSGEQKPNETCVAVGWIELSLYLFKITKDVRYINAIDKTLYNHILASIAENGDDFAYYQPNYGKKIRTTETTRYKCCRYRGFTLFVYMPDMLFSEDKDTLIPMIYTDCEYESESVKLTEKTKYPFEGDISFNIDVTQNRLLKLRIPAGYDVSYLKINAENEQILIRDGYINIALESGKSYEINLSLIPKITVEKGIIDGQNVAALNYGQTLLALCDEDNDIKINVDELNLVQLKDSKEGYVVFSEKGIKNKKEVDVIFTDYASADNYKVWFSII